MGTGAEGTYLLYVAVRGRIETICKNYSRDRNLLNIRRNFFFNEQCYVKKNGLPRLQRGGGRVGARLSKKVTKQSREPLHWDNSSKREPGDRPRFNDSSNRYKD